MIEKRLRRSPVPASSALRKHSVLARLHTRQRNRRHGNQFKEPKGLAPFEFHDLRLGTSAGSALVPFQIRIDKSHQSVDDIVFHVHLPRQGLYEPVHSFNSFGSRKQGACGG